MMLRIVIFFIFFAANINEVIKRRKLDHKQPNCIRSRVTKITKVISFGGKSDPWPGGHFLLLGKILFRILFMGKIA